MDKDVQNLVSTLQADKTLLGRFMVAESLMVAEAMEAQSSVLGRVASSFPAEFATVAASEAMVLGEIATEHTKKLGDSLVCLLYTSPSPRD